MKSLIILTNKVIVSKYQLEFSGQLKIIQKFRWLQLNWFCFDVYIRCFHTPLWVVKSIDLKIPRKKKLNNKSTEGARERRMIFSGEGREGIEEEQQSRYHDDYLKWIFPGQSFN